MKNILIIAASIFSLTACSTLSDMMPSGSQSSFKEYKVRTLPNGLNILTIKDEKLPYITLNAFIMGGYSQDPKNQTGVSVAALNLLDKGYNGIPAEKISASIEQLGADFDTEVSADYSTVAIDGLAWQQDKLLDIFSQLLMKPDFNEKEIQRYKSKTIGEVKQRLDQLNYLASEIYDEDFYKNHPYGHRDLGTINDITKMERKDISKQYHTMLNPKNVWIVVVGQFPNEFIDRIAQTFTPWTDTVGAQAQLKATVEPIHGREIILVNKPDAVQAEIRIGHSMIDRQNPDYIASMVANTILGQGFSSRLMDDIRVKQGLTYNISSDLDMRLLGSGFKIHTFTKTESAGKIISEIYKTYGEFHKNGVSQQELDGAKQYLIGKFPMLIETPEKFAFNLMVLRVFHVSDDYLKNYQQNVGGINLNQVNDAIQKHFDPDNMKIVIVANKDKVLSQLKGLGNITVVEAKQFIK